MTAAPSERLQAALPLTAKLDKLAIKVDRPTLSAEDIKKLEVHTPPRWDGAPLTRVPPASLATTFRATD